MTSTRDGDAILPAQSLPLEFLRLPSCQRAEVPKVASMVSGIAATRQPDEAICPFMLRRNLVVPARQEIGTQHVFRTR